MALHKTGIPRLPTPRNFVKGVTAGIPPLPMLISGASKSITLPLEAQREKANRLGGYEAEPEQIERRLKSLAEPYFCR